LLRPPLNIGPAPLVPKKKQSNIQLFHNQQNNISIKTHNFTYTYKSPCQKSIENINVSLYIFLLLCGDVETDLGPMTNVLHTHPIDHHQKNKSYFILGTIKLRFEYKHCSSNFSPHYINTHHLYHQYAHSHTTSTRTSNTKNTLCTYNHTSHNT
jgi:hypothetical protein